MSKPKASSFWYVVSCCILQTWCCIYCTCLQISLSDTEVWSVCIFLLNDLFTLGTGISVQVYCSVSISVLTGYVRHGRGAVPSQHSWALPVHPFSAQPGRTKCWDTCLHTGDAYAWSNRRVSGWQRNTIMFLTDILNAFLLPCSGHIIDQFSRHFWWAAADVYSAGGGWAGKRNTSEHAQHCGHWPVHGCG